MTKKKKNETVATLPLTVDTTGIMETKLTRSEAIELMLQDAIERVEAQLKENRQKQHDVQQLTHAEVQQLIPLQPKRSRFAPRFHIGDNMVSVDITYDASNIPQFIKDKENEYRILLGENNRLNDVLRVLQDRGKAKLTIMKQVLEGSEDGRDFLRKVESMSVSLTGRLIKASEKVKQLKDRDGGS